MRIFYATMEFMDAQTLKLERTGLAQYIYKVGRKLVDYGHDVNVVVGADRNGYIKFKGINVFFVQVNDFALDKLKSLFIKNNKNLLYNKFGDQKRISDFILKQHKKQPIDIVQYPNTYGMANFANPKIPYCVMIADYAPLYQKSIDYFDDIEEKTEVEIDKSARFLFSPSAYTVNKMHEDKVIDKDVPIIETPSIPFNSDKEIPSLAYTIKDKTGGANYLLFFGTICKKNGVLEIAECIYDILKKYENIYIVFVGKIKKSEDGLLPLLKKKAGEFVDRILWFDQQDHKHLYPILKRSYGILLPSRYENFGNSYIESMMFRKVVIGAEGYCSQLINDGENGFLCKPYDKESLKSKIIEFMEISPEKKYSMEQEAFARTEVLHPEIISQKLLDYYKEVIANWE